MTPTLNGEEPDWAAAWAEMCNKLLHIWQQVVAESGPQRWAGVASWRRATEVPTLDSATRFTVGVSHSSGQPPCGAGDPTRPP